MPLNFGWFVMQWWQLWVLSVTCSGNATLGERVNPGILSCLGRTDKRQAVQASHTQGARMQRQPRFPGVHNQQPRGWRPSFYISGPPVLDSSVVKLQFCGWNTTYITLSSQVCWWWTCMWISLLWHLWMLFNQTKESLPRVWEAPGFLRVLLTTLRYKETPLKGCGWQTSCHVLVLCGYLVSHDVIIHMNTMPICSGPRTGTLYYCGQHKHRKIFPKNWLCPADEVTTHGWLSSDF